MYFAYGEEETDYLKKKDKRMAEVIDRIGHVERKVDTDLFSAVVHHIVGQQISTKAQETIWQRMLSVLGEVNAETVLAAGVSKLQSLGMTFRKAEYITDFERLCYMCFPRWFAVADTAWNGRAEKTYREYRLAAKSYCDALRKMGVSSAPECDWDESPQKRLRETLAFADNLMTKNKLRQLLNVEE